MEGGSGSIRWHTAATESHDLCLFPLSVLVSTYYIHAEGVRQQLLVVSTSLLQTVERAGKKNQRKGNEFITNRYRWLEIYSLDRRKDTELIFLLASWHCRKFVPCPGRKLKIPYWSKKKRSSRWRWSRKDVKGTRRRRSARAAAAEADSRRVPRLRRQGKAKWNPAVINEPARAGVTSTSWAIIHPWLI